MGETPANNLEYIKCGETNEPKAPSARRDFGKKGVSVLYVTGSTPSVSRKAEKKSNCEMWLSFQGTYAGYWLIIVSILLQFSEEQQLDDILAKEAG